MEIFRHFEKQPFECVMTVGNYDGIHLGHQALINHVITYAKKERYHSAVMTFEPHPREFFDSISAPSRIISLREKLEFFDGLGINRVHVIRFDADFAKISAVEFTNILKNNLNVKRLVLGKDFRFGQNREGGVEMLKNAGIEIIVADEFMINQERVSSSLVRESLSHGDFKKVNLLLGRPYAISGKVIHGDKRGREIGFPTANIHMFHERPPLRGVFAVKLDDSFGVANLGVRPTVSGLSQLNLEVHVFDFSADLYGKHVHVTFLKKLRDEKKFKNVNELKLQIEIDIANAKSFFKNL
ncbi:MAG: bifunctional riboflavin kinase/FAD synthetase [Methylophilaceae bacterium]|nr:bifunctional riboflavin kinase/FAD synthetase [Methylophilaceae bacterium]MBL6729074.1 bifunctional riboflavin kinase/FAD synthetase [Methylophilaceae bacterium]MBL6791292.1 bifunctional riboflavin kinase/FAD synthetase [Methylophilaceae bacterium]